MTYLRSRFLVAVTSDVAVGALAAGVPDYGGGLDSGSISQVAALRSKFAVVSAGTCGKAGDPLRCHAGVANHRFTVVAAIRRC